MLHNLCIKHKDPYKPQLRLEEKELSLVPQIRGRGEDKNGSDLTVLKASNWFWNMRRRYYIVKHINVTQKYYFVCKYDPPYKNDNDTALCLAKVTVLKVSKIIFHCY